MNYQNVFPITDTGHGVLYTSDVTGIIFAESLANHLYPNYQDLTDFYKVKSMRGVYISSQMADDQSIHTMISYDRGGEWKPIERPAGVPCKDESKVKWKKLESPRISFRGERKI